VARGVAAVIWKIAKVAKALSLPCKQNIHSELAAFMRWSHAVLHLRNNPFIFILHFSFCLLYSLPSKANALNENSLKSKKDAYHRQDDEA